MSLVLFSASLFVVSTCCLFSLVVKKEHNERKEHNGKKEEHKERKKNTTLLCSIRLLAQERGREKKELMTNESANLQCCRFCSASMLQAQQT